MKPIKPQSIELLDDVMVDVLRTKTPTERLAVAFDCNRFVRLRLKGHFATRHPHWTPEQIAAAVAERLLHGTS